jgi:hypothetical protein
MSEYIYCLIEREFIKTGENVFKIGRTNQDNYDRFKQYPKGSKLIYQCMCVNSKEAEKEIINKSKEKLKLRKDIGNEYFEGDINVLIDIINESLLLHRPVNFIIKSDSSSESSSESFKKIKTIDSEDSNSESSEISDSEKDDMLFESIHFGLCSSYSKILNQTQDSYKSLTKFLEHNGRKKTFSEKLSFLTELMPNYKQDICLGGKKKLIKILKIDDSRKNDSTHLNEFTVFFIDLHIPKKELCFDPETNEVVEVEVTEKILEIRICDLYSIDRSFLKEIFKKGTLEDGEIYDFNEKFLNKINKKKKKITLNCSNSYLDKYAKHKIIDYNSFFNKCDCDDLEFKYTTLFSNSILNDYYYVDNNNGTLYSPYQGIPLYKYGEIELLESIKLNIETIKIGDDLYDYQYLRDYLPYRIYVIEDKYYVKNRESVALSDHLPEGSTRYNQFYIFSSYKEDNAPEHCWHRWEIYDDYSQKKSQKKRYDDLIKGRERFKMLTEGKTCLNLNENTKYLMNLD